jgi:hypothetical protein
MLYLTRDLVLLVLPPRRGFADEMECCDGVCPSEPLAVMTPMQGKCFTVSSLFGT